MLCKRNGVELKDNGDTIWSFGRGNSNAKDWEIGPVKTQINLKILRYKSIIKLIKFGGEEQIEKCSNGW